MHRIGIFAITAAALMCSAATVNALETTATDNIRNVTASYDTRLESAKAGLLAAINNLKDQIDDILARLTALETDLSLIKNNGANNEVQRWNPKLETRLDNIEAKNTAQDTSVTNHNTRITALENAGSASGALKFTYSSTYEAGKKQARAMNNWSYCALTAFSSAEENHSCSITRSGSNWTLNGNAFNEGNTTCKAICVRIEMK